jgi:hypothetical protein
MTLTAIGSDVASGQCGFLGWRQISSGPLSAGGPRHSFMMVYDAARARTQLYGGAQGFFPDYIEYSDTRVLEGSAWRELPVPTPAPKRWELAMSYDSVRGVTVLNGGGSFVGIPGNPGNHHIGGTYEFDGSNWQLKTFGGPNARHGSTLVYDSRRRETILYGGKHNVTGTWAWDGAQWAERAVSGPVPALRGFAGGAFDERRGKVVLFGGGTDSFVPLGDTWEWDGAAWTQVATTGPTARLGPGMAWDSFRQRIVLHGGQDNVLGRRNDIWEWDGSTWTLRSIPGQQPPPRYQFGFAYDAHRNRFIAAGGQDLGAGQSDTWELRGDPYVDRTATDQLVAEHGTALFSVSVISNGPVNLRWRRNGVELTDSPRITGSGTATLSVADVGLADAGNYDLRVTNTCGSFTTAAVRLDLICAADFNQDGGVDGGDVVAFFGAWSAGESNADISQDGGVDGSDVNAFFDRWEAGC